MLRLILTYCFLLCVFGASGQLYINEVMVSNTGSSFKESHHDWVEIYNAGEDLVNLKDYALTDDPENLRKWAFPKCQIQAQSFLVIHLTGTDRKQIRKKYYANFKLKSNGEPLIFSNATGEVLDQLPPIPSSGGQSFGRVKDGLDQFEILSKPSPGQSNKAVSGVVFSHHSGFYSFSFMLELFENSNDTIFYTLDGSDPSPQSLLYEEGVWIEDQTKKDSEILHKKFNPGQVQDTNGDVYKGNVIKAAVFKDGEQCSDVYVRSYFIHPQADQLYNGWNVVSLVVDSTDFFDNELGIYMPGKKKKKEKREGRNYFGRGKEWERSCHFTFFDRQRNIKTQQHIGIRIRGGTTRQHLQKSFRLQARESGGFKRFSFNAFKENEWFNGESLVLRGVTGCRHNSLLKDVCTATICDSMDIDIAQFSDVGTIVFLNGIYWGIYDLREHLGAKGLAEKYQVPKDSINLHLIGAGFHPDCDADWGNLNGSLEKHRKLYRFIAENDLNDSTNYAFVCSELDIPSFIDYYCAEIFFNNQDWIKSNCKLWSKGNSGKFRFVFFDLDASWISPEENTLAKFLDLEQEDEIAMPYATLYLRKMMESRQFQFRFANRMCELLNSTFSFERIDQILMEFEKRYEPVVKEHIDRWGGHPSTVFIWRYKFYLFREFVEKRHESIKKHFAIYLSGMAPCF